MAKSINHQDLRAELERAGRRFVTDHSDTETLLHGYAAWGLDLIPRLNGMFAFALLDQPRNHLILARDRFGEKPLFYGRTRDGIAFASELHALLAHPDIDSAIAPRALQKLFAHGFIPGPNALCRGARKLPGGTTLTIAIDRPTHPVEPRPYWRYRCAPNPDIGDGDAPALAQDLRAHLSSAVRRRLMADTPLGVFLSGGGHPTGLDAMAP